MAAPQRSDQPRPGKRERSKAENFEAILAAARRVFADFGHEAASVRDVIGASPLAAALVLGGITALQSGAGKPTADLAF